MSDSILEISHKHGREMRKLALLHSLEMAILYRDYGGDPIDQLIVYLETKLASEERENDDEDES